MKVKISKVCWYRWENQKGLQVQFNNELIALVKDAKVAMQLVRLFFENQNPEKLDIVEMAKESVKIDFAKKVN
jgi:hypothetical protein